MDHVQKGSYKSLTKSKKAKTTRNKAQASPLLMTFQVQGLFFVAESFS